jgi:hypothetical protein
MAITGGANNQQNNRDEGIHKALDNCSDVCACATDTWTFPLIVADGRLGKLCVSQYFPDDYQ